jgi:hypothetical protein
VVRRTSQARRVTARRLDSALLRPLRILCSFHTVTNSDTRKHNTRADTHRGAHTHTHTHTRARARTETHTHTHTLTYTRMAHAHAHTHIMKRTVANPHAHAPTTPHTHNYWLEVEGGRGKLYNY